MKDGKWRETRRGEKGKIVPRGRVAAQFHWASLAPTYATAFGLERELPRTSLTPTGVGARPVGEIIIEVGRAGLEPANLAAPAPKAGASTSFATCPFQHHLGVAL